MAKNTGRGYREGEVRDRSQVYNPVTKTWTKRDAETGEFMGGKEDGDPYKGVRKETTENQRRSLVIARLLFPQGLLSIKGLKVRLSGTSPTP